MIVGWPLSPRPRAIWRPRSASTEGVTPTNPTTC
jgi:hypothetical protein